MSDDVKVPISTDNAVLLLAAAHELGLDPSVVQTRGGHFLVPEKVNQKAFAHEKSKSDEAPAKKATAKKSTTQKPQE